MEEWWFVIFLLAISGILTMFINNKAFWVELEMAPTSFGASG